MDRICLVLIKQQVFGFTKEKTSTMKSGAQTVFGAFLQKCQFFSITRLIKHISDSRQFRESPVSDSLFLETK